MTERLISHYKVVIKHAGTGAVLRTVEPISERRFIYEYAWNVEDHGGTPARSFVLELYAVDDQGNLSEPLVKTATNPAPAAPSNLNLAEGFNNIIVRPTPPAATDLAGMRVWVGTTPGFTPSDANLRYDGPNNEASIPVAATGTYYVRAAFFDTFGKTDLNLSSEQSVVVTLSAADPVDTTPPGEPSNLSVTAAFTTLLAQWQNPLDTDLSHVEVWVGPNNQLQNAVLRATPLAPAASAAVSGLANNSTFHVWVRAVDNSGNTSGFVGPQSASTRRLVADEIGDQIINAQKLADNAVTQAKIAANAVGEAQIQALAVNAQKLADNAVTLAKLAANSVDVTKLVDNAVTQAKIAANAVGEAQIAALAVNAQKLADNAVTLQKIANGAVDANKLANGAVTLTKFASGLTPVEIVSALPTTGNFEGRTVVLTTDGKLYRRVGTQWTASVPAADITGQVQAAQIAALEAAKITGQLTNTQIAALDAAKLTGQITSVQISDEAITAPKLAAGSVITAKLAAGAVTADQIAANAVTAVKINAGAVTTAKIAAGAVTADQIAANTITAAQIAANTITAAQIAANTITAAQIAAATITAAEIAANAVTAVKINAGAVTTAKIAAGAVTADQIAANTITAAQIAAATITGNQIAANTIAAGNIAANAVTADKINANAVTADKIAANSVTTAKIATGAITAAQVAAGAITASKLFVGDTTNMIPDGDLLDPAAWSMGGGWTIASNGANLANITTTRYARSEATLSGGADNQFLGGMNPVGTWPVTPGMQIAVRAASRTQAGAVGRIQMVVTWFDVDGVALSGEPSVFSRLAPYTGAQVDTAIVTAPANAAYMRFRLRRAADPSGNSSGWIAVWDMQIRRAVSGELIVDGAVTADKIFANSVTTAKIAAGAVTANEIAANAVTADKILAGSVTTLKLAAGAVTAAQIAANTITAAQIAAFTITASEIATNAITADKILAGSVTTLKLAAGAVTADQIAANAVTADKILAGSVTTLKLAAGAVTADRIAANTITAAQIAAFTITAAEIAANAITAAKILAGAVVADKIAAGAVIADKIGAGAITTDKLAAGAVTADKILAGSITGNRISSTTAINVGSGNSLGGGLFDRAAILGEGSNANPVRIHAGHTSPLESPFQVDRAGNVVARKLTIYTPDGGSVWFDTDLGFSELARSQILAQSSPRVEQLTSSVNTNSAPITFTLVETKTITGRVRVNRQALHVTQSYQYGDPVPADAFPSTLTLVLRTRPVGGSWTTRVTRNLTKITSGTPNSNQFKVQVWISEPTEGIWQFEPGMPGFKTEIVELPEALTAEFSASFSGSSAGTSYEMIAELTPTGGALGFNTKSRTLELSAPGKDFVLDIGLVQGEGNAETLQGLGPNDFWRKTEITPVPTSRIVTAGNGFTGGGNLGANITLTLGTPGTLGNGSTNNVTASSHTHALSLVANDIPNLPISKITNLQTELDNINAQIGQTGQFSGRVTFANTFPGGQAPVNLPNVGTSDPSTVVNGDIWHRSDTMYARLGGITRVMVHNGTYTDVSQAAAEAGASTDRHWWTAQRVRQAIVAAPIPYSNLTGVPSTFTPAAHTHNANDINAGVLNVARIPNLPAGQITSGTLDVARLPVTANQTDTTANRLLRTGDGGVLKTGAGVALPTGDYASDIQSGLFSYNAGSTSNAPESASWGHTSLVMRGAASDYMNMLAVRSALSTSNLEAWIGHRRTASVSWARLWHEGNFNPSSLNASNLTSGVVASARISGSYTGITGTGALNAGSISSGFGNINIGSSTFTGNGSGLTNLNGSNIATGTVADARLAQTMTGKTFSGPLNFNAELPSMTSYGAWGNGFMLAEGGQPFSGAVMAHFAKSSIRGFQLAGSSFGAPQLWMRGIHTGFTNGFDNWVQFWHTGNFTPTAQSAANLTSGTLDAARLPAVISDFTKINFTTANARNKLSIHGTGDQYVIGMNSGYTLGSLSNQWAMTFQMDDTAGSGFWWGRQNHTNAQGAMSLTTDGALFVSQSITCAGNITRQSDRNLKHSIRPWEADFTDLVNQMKPSRFGWNDSSRPQDDFGLIAQDVEELFPELVEHDYNGNKSVDYAKLAVVAIGALKQMDARLRRLEALLGD